MKRPSALALFAFLSIFCVSLIPTAHAKLTADRVLKMNQAQFALALVKEAGAMKRLSPAASGQDAIDFLQSLGIVPEGGWEANKMVDEDFLKRLVEGTGREAAGTIEELIQQVEDIVGTAIDALPAEQNVSSGGAGSSGA